MDKIFIFLLCFYFGSAKIKINNLKVPGPIESGSVEDAILDCDFDSGGENGVEVKFFYNGLVDQIYQWIPGSNLGAQALGTLKDNIDATYQASNDKKTMYRALRIVNPSPELSGNYSCKVSGYVSEDVVTKSLIIYDPPDSGLDLDIAEDESVITCSADGLYPQPELLIYINVTNDNESETLFKEDDEIVELDVESGLYNVTSSLYYNPENLTGPFLYICELTLPGTSYRLREQRTYDLETDDIETQIEEDYLNLLNSTNSTESSFEELQEYETQIEEDLETDFNTTSTAETTTNIDDTITVEETKDNGSPKHLANVSLFSMVFLIIMLSSLYL